jgi:hypothetical protein
MCCTPLRPQVVVQPVQVLKPVMAQSMGREITVQMPSLHVSVAPCLPSMILKEPLCRKEAMERAKAPLLTTMETRKERNLPSLGGSEKKRRGGEGVGGGGGG